MHWGTLFVVSSVFSRCIYFVTFWALSKQTVPLHWEQRPVARIYCWKPCFMTFFPSVRLCMSKIQSFRCCVITGKRGRPYLLTRAGKATEGRGNRLFKKVSFLQGRPIKDKRAHLLLQLQGRYSRLHQTVTVRQICNYMSYQRSALSTSKQYWPTATCWLGALLCVLVASTTPLNVMVCTLNAASFRLHYSFGILMKIW